MNKITGWPTCNLTICIYACQDNSWHCLWRNVLFVLPLLGWAICAIVICVKIRRYTVDVASSRKWQFNGLCAHFFFSRNEKLRDSTLCLVIQWDKFHNNYDDTVWQNQILLVISLRRVSIEPPLYKNGSLFNSSSQLKYVSLQSRLLLQMELSHEIF
jgi:hypothetical protein